MREEAALENAEASTASKAASAEAMDASEPEKIYPPTRTPSVIRFYEK
jgi:hypothetical protein